ncbi:MAG: hypothetical protein CL786_03320 [Chloroflexi bacterium]|nr:hypothetical protein [Chloroflexota bacterium]
MVNNSKLGEKSPTVFPICLTEGNSSISTLLVLPEDTLVELLQPRSKPTRETEIKNIYKQLNFISFSLKNIHSIQKNFVFFSAV